MNIINGGQFNDGNDITNIFINYCNSRIVISNIDRAMYKNNICTISRSIDPITTDLFNKTFGNNERNQQTEDSWYNSVYLNIIDWLKEYEDKIVYVYRLIHFPNQHSMLLLFTVIPNNDEK